MEVAGIAGDGRVRVLSSVPNRDFKIDDRLHAERFDDVELSLVGSLIGDDEIDGREAVRFEVLQ